MKSPFVIAEWGWKAGAQSSWRLVSVPSRSVLDPPNSWVVEDHCEIVLECRRTDSMGMPAWARVYDNDRRAAALRQLVIELAGGKVSLLRIEQTVTTDQVADITGKSKDELQACPIGTCIPLEPANTSKASGLAAGIAAGVNDMLRARVLDLEAGVEAGRRAASACREVTSVLRQIEQALDTAGIPDAGDGVLARVESALSRLPASPPGKG